MGGWIDASIVFGKGSSPPSSLAWAPLTPARPSFTGRIGRHHTHPTATTTNGRGSGLWWRVIDDPPAAACVCKGGREGLTLLSMRSGRCAGGSRFRVAARPRSGSVGAALATDGCRDSSLYSPAPPSAHAYRPSATAHPRRTPTQQSTNSATAADASASARSFSRQHRTAALARGPRHVLFSPRD
jgi:hypothetical protein